MGENRMITIVDYGMGNLHSVSKAVEAVGGDAVISGKIEDIRAGDQLILPGVGAFGEGMKNLKKAGLIEVLYEEVIQKQKPLFGICLGMQLLAKSGEEKGYHKGLGFVDAVVKRFSETRGLKVPHVGWNEIKPQTNLPLFKNLPKHLTFYFVHSYHMVCHEPVVAATCEYGEEFTAAICKKNIFATQFHPEKSQQAGLQLLENFLNWNPE